MELRESADPRVISLVYPRRYREIGVLFPFDNVLNEGCARWKAALVGADGVCAISIFAWGGDLLLRIGKNKADACT